MCDALGDGEVIGGEPLTLTRPGQPVRSQAPMTASEFNEIKARIPALDAMPDAVPHGEANAGFVALFHSLLDAIQALQGAQLPGRIRSRAVAPPDASEEDADGRC